MRAQMRVAALVAVVALAGPPSAQAAPVKLETAALRLEVTAEPYAYQLVEKATGQVLVSRSGTRFVVQEQVAQPDAGAAPDAPVEDGGAAGIDAGAPDGGTADAADASGDGAAADVPPDAPPPPPVREITAPVTRATAVVPGPAALDADLALDGIPETAHVRFSFRSPEVLEVQLTLGGRTAVRVQEELDDRQEHYYGIWEYPFGGNLDNRGNDGDYQGQGANPVTRFTSGRAPFYVTSRRYGVYARSAALGHYQVAVGGKTTFSFDQSSLTYDVIYGPGTYDVLARYTAIAGGPIMPPLWAFGSIWWHDDFHRDLHGANAQENVIDLATQLRARHIPASGLLIDRPYGTGPPTGWGNMDWDDSFPDPPTMVSELHTRGLELVLWIANRAWNGLYTEGQPLGYLFPMRPENGPAADMRNPAAYDWFRGKLDPFVALGAKGYKIDRGEEGEQPAAVENENVTLFAKMAQEGLAARHGAEAFMFTRDVADTGRKYTAVWSGDSASTFAGLTYSMTAGLRSGAIVMPMWGSDTGGYLRSPTAPTEEVFARWLGLGAWSPMMEVLVGDSHTPWYNYSPALVEIARKHTTTHHDLIPYTRSFVHAGTISGAPVMRPLVFSFPDDATLANRSDEYLFGSELLVAPVITAGATTRAVYVPQGEGRWLDYSDRRSVFSGGQTANLAAPLDTVPVLVREGGIVPRGRLLRGNDDWTPGWAPALRIEVFPSDKALSRQLDYFTGTAVEPITATTAGDKVTVTFGALGAPGTVELQLARVGTVSRNGAALAAGKDYQFDAAARLLTVPFAGPTTLVVEGAVSVFVPAGSPGDGGGDAGVPRESQGCSCTVPGTPARRGGLVWTLLLVAAACARSRGSARRRL